MEASKRVAGKKRPICCQDRVPMLPGQGSIRVMGSGIPGFIRRISQWTICIIMNGIPSVLGRRKARLLAPKENYKY
jgi:hypothetical protein